MSKRKNNQVLLNEPYGLIELEQLTVLVKALHTRIVYGRREYQVTPVAGTGETWVYGNNITWHEEPQVTTVQKIKADNKGKVRKNAVR